MNNKGLSGDDVIFHTVYISIGSNVGNPLENCKNAITVLKETGGIQVQRISGFYKTEPVDYKEQAWFINAVVNISTSLEPVDLFNTLKLIEKNSGRTENSVRFGPRILDLDIIFYDDMLLVTPDLVIPHPRMHVRRFVLRPLCDINSNFIHPKLNKTVKELLEQISDTGQRLKEYP